MIYFQSESSSEGTVFAVSYSMALFTVDSNGQRIKTDTLVCGYVRNIMDIYNLEIPDEIIALCFLFWIIKVCDQWDGALYDKKRIEIDGSCGKWDRYASLFGTKSVEVVHSHGLLS